MIPEHIDTEGWGRYLSRTYSREMVAADIFYSAAQDIIDWQISRGLRSDAPYSFWLGDVEREFPRFVIAGEIDEAALMDWTPGMPIRVKRPDDFKASC